VLRTYPNAKKAQLLAELRLEAFGGEMG
jgi:hypothetical protein